MCLSSSGRTAQECLNSASNAPMAEAAEFLRKVRPRVDRKDGPWDIAVGGNKDRVDFGHLQSCGTAVRWRVYAANTEELAASDSCRLSLSGSVH